MIVLKMSILIDSPNPMFITNCNIMIQDLLQYWKIYLQLNDYFEDGLSMFKMLTSSIILKPFLK
jgi:hypothetical protein